MPLVVSCNGQLNWASYCPKIAIKEQALSNFVAEFMHHKEIEPESERVERLIQKQGRRKTNYGL